ncbi:hypothetical protein CIPAW_15G053100 [Carya illinoinensis]|uniref:Secreted protein n=1 Tax=Carya illinoinensis TaxID=32201 RepID=A0A8T1NAD6_CARIL|nr:hypothetical protein CIPAW_15G053100 [Carya illinoinensis]
MLHEFLLLVMSPIVKLAAQSTRKYDPQMIRVKSLFPVRFLMGAPKNSTICSERLKRMTPLTFHISHVFCSLIGISSTISPFRYFSLNLSHFWFEKP